MKVRFAHWMMRRHAFKHLPARVQNWAIEQHLMTFPSYRRLVLVRDETHPFLDERRHR